MSKSAGWLPAGRGDSQRSVIIFLEVLPNLIPYRLMMHEWVSGKKGHFLLWSIQQYPKRTKWKKGLFSIWHQSPGESDGHWVMGRKCQGWGDSREVQVPIKSDKTVDIGWPPWWVSEGYRFCLWTNLKGNTAEEEIGAGNIELPSISVQANTDDAYAFDNHYLIGSP